MRNAMGALLIVVAALAAGCGHGAGASSSAAGGATSSAGASGSAPAGSTSPSTGAASSPSTAAVSGTPPPAQPKLPLTLQGAISPACRTTLRATNRDGAIQAQRLTRLAISGKLIGDRWATAHAEIVELERRIEAIRSELASETDVTRANQLVDEGNALVDRHNALVRGGTVLRERAQRQDRSARAANRAAWRADSKLGNAVARCVRAVKAAAWQSATRRLEHDLAVVVKRAGVAKSAITIVCEPWRAWRSYGGSDVGSARFQLEGFVDPQGPHVVHLSPSTCLALDDLLTGRVPTRSTLRGAGCISQTRTYALLALCPPLVAASLSAVVTLAHEVEHTTGVADEARATCSAMQHAARYARLFGLRAREIPYLGVFVESRSSRPARYRSQECRKGGKLDLGIHAAWPPKGTVLA